jgi:hypothetical protein
MLKAEKISFHICKITRQVIHTAIAYENITGRKLGITGEIGEVLVCKELGLKLLSNPIAAGFDAVNDNGKKFQIKTRRGKTDSPGARIGSFSKHKFDEAILAILDNNYNIVELYKATYRKLEPILKRHKKRNPTLHQFKRVASVIKFRRKK